MNARLAALALTATVIAAPVAWGSTAADELFLITRDATTVEQGCISQAGKTVDQMLSEAGTKFKSVDMRGGLGKILTSAGEPVAYVTGENAEGDIDSVEFSTKAGCVERLAQYEAHQQFTTGQVMHDSPEYISRVSENIRRLNAGLDIAGQKPVETEKVVEGYVSNNSQTAYLYKGDCEDGSGKLAQEVTDQPRTVTGCWRKQGNSIIIEWQLHVTRGTIQKLPRGKFVSVFGLPT